MTARVIGATIRDLTYILATLRPEDRAEIDCQFDEWNPELIALQALQGPAYVVELDGNPEAALGAAEIRKGLWIAWSWGRPRMWRCVPLMTRFFFAVLGPHVAAQGAWRVEARPLASNEVALRWLKRLGATERCLLPGYGKNGETFALYDWTRERWRHSLENAKEKQPGAVLVTPSPGLSPDLSGGHDEYAKATATRVSAPVL